MSESDDDDSGDGAASSPIDEADVAARAEGPKSRRKLGKSDTDDVANARDKRRQKEERQARQDAARDATPEDPQFEDCRLGGTRVIKIETNETMVNDKAIYMLATNDLEIFHRGDALVRIQLPSTKNTKTGPKIAEIKHATLREKVASSADWMKFSSPQERWLPSHPPDWCVDAVHARASWPGVRPLIGLVEAPTLRPDGTVLDVPGYDAATGLCYVPPVGVTFLPVPGEPTHEDAVAALADLNEVLSDFPFAGETAAGSVSGKPAIGAHRSAALAVLLTMCAKDAIEGNIPLGLAEAAAQGTGKTLMFDAFSIIAFGRPLARAPYPKDEAELSKTITALAIEGASTIFFDNIGPGQTLGGPVIDAMLTGLVYKARILGVSRTVEVPFRPIVLATGNNVELGSDTTRRVLLVRLESQDANPAKRSGFQHDDLLTWVSHERPRLLCAALTLVKAYFHASRPAQRLEAWGSYNEWSRIIRAALVWAGAEDPGKVRETIADAESDQDRGLLALVIDGLRNLGKMTASELCRLVENPGQAHLELRDALDQMTGPNGKLTPRGVSRRLRQLRGRVVQSGDRREHLVMDTTSSRGTLWSVSRLPDAPSTGGADAGVGGGSGTQSPGAPDATATGMAVGGTAGAEPSVDWEGL